MNLWKACHFISSHTVLNVLFSSNLLMKLRPDWLDTESCGHYATTRILVQAIRASKWKLAAVVLARMPSNHGLGHRSTMQWSVGFLHIYVYKGLLVLTHLHVLVSYDEMSGEEWLSLQNSEFSRRLFRALPSSTYQHSLYDCKSIRALVKTAAAK